MPELVVGVDGSPAAQRALEQAVRSACRTGARVRAVTTWSLPGSLSLHGLLAPDPALVAAREEAEFTAMLLLEDAVRRATADGAPPAGVEELVVEGQPAPVLARLSLRASTVLLGAREGGRLGSILASAVPQVLRHAAAPVVLVPDHAISDPAISDPANGEQGRVVVGWDGSPGAWEALLWGLGVARAEDRALLVVHAAAAPGRRSRWRRAPAAGPCWQDDVRAALAPEDRSRLSLEERWGRPEEVLAQAVRPSDLLVLGGPEPRRADGALLGMTAGACLAAPRCAVALVRPAAQDASPATCAEEDAPPHQGLEGSPSSSARPGAQSALTYSAGILG